jgi:hypothetical protein
MHRYFIVARHSEGEWYPRPKEGGHSSLSAATKAAEKYAKIQPEYSGWNRNIGVWDDVENRIVYRAR